jgi:hypothetical protein
VTNDEAMQWILDALADLPSGPPGEEVLAALLAAAWDEGSEARRAYAYSDDMEPLTNPYRE